MTNNWQDGSCVCGHAEDASYTLGILLHFIRSSAKITYSRWLKFPFWFIWYKLHEYYCERKYFLLGIWNANNQTKKVFTTHLSRFSYVLMLLLLCGDIEIWLGPQNTLSDFCKSREYKIVHQNVRGILSSHHLLESFVNKTEPKIDVICVSETHIKDGDICGNSLFFTWLCIFTTK